ncbi:HEAT SHOCK PROTEIN 90 HSP90 CO-CHAPERONE AHA-1 [Salix purpurea]|uniref:HEAT SHOCK PROTEIN 90 HSP90 CO-CHAPERONE AHA-1 n=1 Tax=Salix purpurea TaxID=77065 RepID=A0A9Q0Q413_SALPP|nr:HEAT SHOCK PROTEIN 90 HSP90 CO-CHAPERONE AHA-1 [Salix purpurea]
MDRAWAQTKDDGFVECGVLIKDIMLLNKIKAPVSAAASLFATLLSSASASSSASITIRKKKKRMENGGGGDIEYAAPLPLPKKLSPQDHLHSQPNNLGSAWNTAGTWEEKNLNNWATHRIKDLLLSVASLEFSGGKAEIAQVSKCSGDDADAYISFLLIQKKHLCQAAIEVGLNLRKKRLIFGTRNVLGYTYELTLKIKGEWIVKEEKRMVKGDIDFPEFSFGELDDLQMEVQLNDVKDLSEQDKQTISQDLKLFLQPVREKLLQFEQELRDR